MALDASALSALCLQIPAAPTDLCIPFPGGAELCPQQGLQLGDPSAVVQSLLSSVNAALLPLQPFFTMIQTIKAVIDCVQAIPDSLGPPPDPTAIAQCIPPLLEQVEKLLKLLPQYSVPLLVKRLLLLVATALRALKNELQTILQYQARIALATTAAAQPGNELLQTILDCANANANATLANLQGSMQPIAGLLNIINILLELIGQEPLDGLPAIADDAAAALQPLDDFVKVLTDIANAIPG